MFLVIGHLGLLGWSEISKLHVRIGEFDLEELLELGFGEFGLLGIVGLVPKFVFL